ncbi:MAG: hypothetical protein ABSB22_04295 [Thermodesulfobacteriota bacterium]
MAKKSLYGVVLKETFVKARRKWIFCLILANMVYGRRRRRIILFRI